MPVRPATWADLLPASRFLATAFKEETLAGKFMHPHRHEYPDDMYLYFLPSMRVTYCRGPDYRMIVTYDTDEHGKETRVTGFAHWVRRRTTPPPDSLYTKAKVKAMENYNYIESFIYTNRAADPSRPDIMAGMGAYTKHYWTGTRAETWYLSLVGTDPAQQKRGIGRELVKYGFDRAKEEGVGCSVICGDGRDRFYQACGFDAFVGYATDECPEDHPLKHLEGGQIRFWDNGRDLSGVKQYGEV